MKIQLKRSNQLDGGSAKEPTIAQMEYGELAVNYNVDDPAVFIKDSDDNIIRIAGVGSINSGDVPSGGSGEKPGSPSVGDLYFDTTLEVLLYWNGNEWIEISSTLVADGSTAALPDATEHVEGTLWWDSDSAAGKLFICYNDPDQGKLWVEASPMPNSNTLPDISDPNNQGGTLDTRYVRADVTDHKQGNLTIGDGPGNNNIQLYENGSATFTGEVSADTGAFSRNVSNDNVTILYGGNDNGIKFALKGNGTYIGSSLADINNATPTGSKISLESDGSGAFSGTVDVGDVQIDHRGSVLIAADDTRSLYFGCYKDSLSGGNEVFRIDRDGNTALGLTGSGELPSRANISLSAETGSAEFKGNVDLNGITSSNSIVVDRTGGTQTAYQANLNGVKKAEIKADGSAEFADGKVTVSPGGNLDADGRISGYRIDLKSGFGGSPATALAVYYDTDATDERISFRADGSALFAGDVIVGDFDGNNSDLGVNNRADGYIFVNSNSPDNASILLLKQNGVQKANIQGNGSATFKGAVTVDTTANGASSNGVTSAIDNDLDSTAAAFSANNKNADGYNFLGVDGSNNNTITFSVKNDGSATFAGDVHIKCGGDDDEKGVKFFNDGEVKIYRPTGSLNNLLSGRAGIASPGTEVFNIKSDGSANFAQAVTVGAGNPTNGGNDGTILYGSGGIGISKASGALITFNQTGSGSKGEIYADGSAQFAGTVKVDGPDTPSGKWSGINQYGSLLIGTTSDTVSDAKVSIDSSSGLLKSEGSANFAGTVQVDTSTAPNFSIEATSASNANAFGTIYARNNGEDGAACYYAANSSGNLAARINNDGTAEFAGTVTANGSILTRSSGTLDVGDRLEKVDSALQALKTAAAASSDFAALKSAIATALADI